MSLVARPALYGDARHWGLVHADALHLLPQLPDACVDAIITDPPYGISFNAEAWDGADIHASFKTPTDR